MLHTRHACGASGVQVCGVLGLALGQVCGPAGGATDALEVEWRLHDVSMHHHAHEAHEAARKSIQHLAYPATP